MTIKLSDIPKLIQTQKDYFLKQETKDIDFRINQLKKLKQVIKKNEDKILDALYKDLRKSKEEAYTTEIGYIYLELSLAIKNLKKWSKPKKVKGTIIFPFSKSFIIKEPFGVTLHISPWNYPFHLALASVIGAIAAGNTIILKPSEVAPATAHIIDYIISKTFKKEFFAVVEGDAKTSQRLLEQNFDYIFYTGNEVVGKIVMQAAANNLTPVTLELGGKSPTIIEESANLEIAAKRIAFGKCLNSGQTCTAPDYVLIQESIKSEFIRQFQLAVREFYTTNEKNSKYYPRIINKHHFDRITDYAKNLKIKYGGEMDREDLFISPTIIENPPENSKLMTEEIFGPILPIITFKKIDEAIDFVNQRPKPLALYIFTKIKEIENKVLNETSAGGACVNDTVVHVANINLPFGGVGTSGTGRYHGKATYELFSNQKGVLKQPTFFDMKQKYPPYNKSKLRLVKLLLK